MTRTVYEELQYSITSCWKLKHLKQDSIIPFGAYFIYQQNWGSPSEGGTQPIWSYALLDLIPLWKNNGGIIYDKNFKILYK